MTAIRRPALKIVERTPVAPSAAAAGRVRHDARGNAIWSDAIDLENTGDLVLEADVAAPRPSDGDPYNRGLSLPRKGR